MSVTLGLRLTVVLARDGFLSVFLGVVSFVSTFSISDGALASCERLFLLYIQTQSEVKFHCVVLLLTFFYRLPIEHHIS